MKKLICVLSSDYLEENIARIKKGLQLYYENPKQNILVFNGFKPNYREDNELKLFEYDLKKLQDDGSLYILLTYNTEENAYMLRKFVDSLNKKNEGIEKIVIVSSKSHIDNVVFGKPGRVKQIFSKFFPYKKLEFVGVLDESKGKCAFREAVLNLTTFLEILLASFGISSKNYEKFHTRLQKIKKILLLNLTT